MAIVKPYPFEAVLFDLDGVLIDTTDLHYRVWDDFARSHGCVPTRNQILSTNGRRAEDNIRLLLGSELSEPEIVRLTSEREGRYHRMLKTESVEAVPGAVHFVHDLDRAQVKIGVATSAMPENANLALLKVGLVDVFRAVVTASDVKKGKPDPEPFLELAKALGCNASNCLVVEDSVSGIRAAKASGAKCLALATTFPESKLAAESPNWLVKGFAQLPAVLRPNTYGNRASDGG